MMRRFWLVLRDALGSGVEAEMRAQRRAAAELDQVLREASRGMGR